MPIALIQPVLADVNFGGIVCTAAIVIMIVGWILNLINSNKNRPRQAARRAGQRRANAGEDRLQSEIDSFLQEVGGGGRRQEAEELEIEIVPDSEQRQRPRRRRRPTSTPAARKSLPAQTPLSERHLESSLESSQLGSDLREHVSDYMGNDHIAQDVELDQNHTVASDWASSGSAQQASAAPAPSGHSSPLSGQNIVQLLRNPASVRQAILVSEVLSPPKSRRR